jgi:hypothetical protein
MLKRALSAIAYAVILMGLVLSPAFGDDVVWREDSWVHAVAVDPGDPNIVYAAVWRHGVLRSLDAGATWTSTRLDASPYVFALAIDPKNPSTVYAAGTYGVFKSTDRGETWSATGYPGFVSHLAIDPANPATLYATAPYGTQKLYKSTDAGTTWSVALQFDWSLSWISNVVFDPTSPSTVYVGGSYARCNWCEMEDWAYWEYWGQLFKSTDGGRTWSFTYLGTDVSLLAITPQALYANSGGLQKSVDGGASWVPLGVGAADLAVDPSDSSTLYASGTGVSRSMNAGASWETFERGLTDMLSVLIGDTHTDALAAAAVQPTTVYVGTRLGVFKSADAGETWGRTGLAQHSPLKSIVVNEETVISGTPLTGAIMLAEPAPPGGLSVTLTTETSTMTPVSSPMGSVIVPAGFTSVDFAITPAPSCASVAHRVWARAGDAARHDFVGITAGLQISTLNLDRPSVTGGDVAMATVTLATPAPSAGGVVSVWTSSASASAPSSVTVPAGSTSASFRVSTTAVTATTTVTVTAQCAESRTVTLTVTPRQAPTISAVQPNSGAVGTVVTLTGTGLDAATATQFTGLGIATGVSAPMQEVSPTSVTVSVPAGAGTGPITLHWAGGTVKSAAAFTVRPAIASLSPSSAAVGAVVTITGTNLLAASGTPVVRVGTVAAAVLSGAIPTQLKFTVPVKASTGRVTVTTVDGTATSPTDLVVVRKR